MERDCITFPTSPDVSLTLVTVICRHVAIFDIIITSDIHIFAVVNWNPLSSNVSYVYATRGRARHASSKLSDIFPHMQHVPP